MTFKLNPAQFAKDIFGSTVPGINAPPPSIDVPGSNVRRIVEYLSAAGLGEDERGCMLIQLFKQPEILELDSEGCESWLWTIVDMAVPGLSQVLLNKSAFYTARPIGLSDATLNYMMFGGTYAERGEEYRLTHPEVTDLPVDLPDLEPIPVALLPGFVYDPNQNLKADWQCCASIVGIVLFAIGKAPTDQNRSAFSERRKLAAERKLGKGGAGVPADDDVPYLAVLKYVNSYFALKTDLREYVVTYFIERLAMPSIEAVEIINTHLRLWFGTGLTHVVLIRDLITGYHEVLNRMAGLRSELVAFEADYRIMADSNEPHKAYLKVMKGDKFQLLNSRKFPELVRLARSVAMLKDERFKNFAPQLGEAKSWGQFKSLAMTKGTYLLSDVPGQTTTVAESAQGEAA